MPNEQGGANTEASWFAPAGTQSSPARIGLGFALVLLTAAALFAGLFQEAFYSIDPPIFAEIYPAAVRDGTGWPNHHHLHFLAWRVAFAASGDVYGSFDAASIIPAALAAAGLWLFLVRRRGASPLVAALLTGAVAGCAPVFFFATTIEVHALQWLAAVVALWPIDVAIRASNAVWRWAAIVSAGALLLLGHPLHALLLPFVAFHIALHGRPRNEPARRTAIRFAAIGVCFGILATLRYMEVQARMGWSPETLETWGAGSRLPLLAHDLWAYLLRAHVAVLPVLALYMARGLDGADVGRVRVASLFLWFVPLTVFVAYLGLFEAGGYFVALGTLWVALLGRDSVEALGRVRAVRFWLVPPAFAAALALSALASGALGLRQAHDPPVGPAEREALEFVRSQVPAEGRLVCFDANLARALRQRSRRSVTGELERVLATVSETLDGHLFDEYRRGIKHDLARGSLIWFFRPEPLPAGRDPRRTRLEERFEAWITADLGAEAQNLNGARVWGPVRSAQKGP